MSTNYQRLSLKIIFPITAIMLLTGVPLYFLIHATVTDFAQQNIKKDLEDLSRYTFDIVDRGFMDLVREGKAGERVATRIKQVDAMDAIELFTRDQHFFVLITAGNKKRILLDSGLNAPERIIAETRQHEELQRHQLNDITYFSRQIYFPPWKWEITVLKDAEEYATLSDRITFFSQLAGTIWLLGTLFLLFYLLKAVQNPLQNIIQAVNKGQYPTYHGTYEFEYLSSSIADMMQSLEQARIKAEDNERQLQRRQEEVQALLDNSPVGILYVNKDRIIEQVNLEAIQQTGYAEEELVGHSTRKFYPDQASFENFGRKAYAKMLTSGTCNMNQQLRHKNGSLVWCRFHGRFFKQNDGSEGGIWIIEDMTEQLKTEAELLKIKKLEAVGVLAGGLAHDFNNLLTAILGNLSLAEHKLPAGSPALPLINNSEKAAIRASDLTRKLLTFSKGDAPIKETSALPDLIRESADFVLHGSGIQCRYTLPEDLWQVDIDQGQISQVIQNLALNARQAMHDNGTMHISCINKTEKELAVAMPSLPPDNYVLITIHDHGPGIPETIIDKVFDPYFSTKELDTTKGSGLGLAIVHSIVEKHNGRITIDSSPNEGTKFFIYLPAVRENREQPAEQQPETPVRGDMQTIMIMDDEPLIRDVAREMLEHLGYTVIPVQDGREALDAYKNHAATGQPVDAVLMDLTIPGGLGGKEAVAELLTFDPDARVIVTSGYATDPIMANYAQYGFKAAINKPFTLNNISTILQSLPGR